MKVLQRKSWYALLLIASVSVLLSSCSFYEEVEVVEIEDVKLVEYNKDFIEAEITLKIKNPNWYKIKLTKSEIELFLNDKKVGDATLLEEIVLPKESFNSRVFKLKADTEKMEGSLLDNLLGLLFTKTAEFRAKGYVKGKALFIGKKVDVDVKEDIDLSKIK